MIQLIMKTGSFFRGSGMSTRMVVMILIASCLSAGNACCAEWKYYGEFTRASDLKEVLFYDANSVINSNNSIKLWVKTVAYTDIEKCMESKTVLEKTSGKSADGYNPPISNVTKAAYLEEAAKDPSVKSKAEILYQIVCSENKFRKISGAAADKNGVLNLPFGISRWEAIAPESNAENLAKIVCGEH